MNQKTTAKVSSGGAQTTSNNNNNNGQVQIEVVMRATINPT
jgi:hypothetical protein